MKLYERRGDELQETKCHKEREKQQEMEGKGKQNGFPLHIHFFF